MTHAPAPERQKLSTMFFIVGLALGLWNINLSSVLSAHGYSALIIDNVWCTSAVAAMIAPLIVGALADQSFSSERVLRGLGLGAAIFVSLLFFGIHQRWPGPVIVLLAQVHALWSAPSFGLATSLVISRLVDAKSQFGPVRVWATFGWMIAGPIVSYVLHSDDDVISGFTAAAVWLIAIAFTYTLKPIPPPAQKHHRTWSDILGLEAWSLLRHHDHRVVFIGAALFNIPLAAFYPHTALHLRELGVEHTTALMGLAQITEAIGLLALSWLLTRVRLKWLFLGGIAAGVLRYGLYAHGTVTSICFGIAMHGVCFTLFYMTAQIYLEHRIPAAMRSRAQALLSLMMSGIGNFIGYQGCGWWRHACMTGTHMDWHRYWLGLSTLIAVIWVWFALSYKGRHNV